MILTTLNPEQLYSIFIMGFFAFLACVGFLIYLAPRETNIPDRFCQPSGPDSNDDSFHPDDWAYCKKHDEYYDPISGDGCPLCRVEDVNEG